VSYASHESATRISAGDAITAEDIQAGGAKASEDAARYALYLGDDALMLAQRLGWWLGHARFFLTYAGTAWGKTEDDLAYFRDEEEFRSCRLVEQENGDFGQTIARQLIFSYYQYELYRRLVRSTDTTLAAIADKALKEVEYHQDHASQWILRLGLGTEESKRRVQAGLYYMWPYVDELFHDDELVESLGDAAVRPSSLRADFDRRLTAILDEAGLSVPEVLGAYGGDRSGQFSEQRGHILAEMQVLARQHPGATW
jgi:ring-1,2-phenylacetyl-CoA epoxidase subunit PaaC